MYTDGVVEARDSAKRLFGVERLIEAARRPASTASDIRQNVMTALAGHVDGAAAADDVTLLVARGVAIEGEP
jgi:serine phosphatase RsbU (regulator of sigma subunit)